jgi:NADP-dependent 3-hydroxy acid dehydrogenase YdfG
MPDDTPVAVVTGASRGLGAAFAQVLAQQGYALALGARNQSDLEQVAQSLPGKVSTHFLNVSDPASVESFQNEVIQEFGRVDVLVNNAGIGLFKRLEDFEVDEFDELFAVNVKGTWLVTKAFLPALKESLGLVIMVSSDVSTRVFPTGGPYTATKFALRSLTRTLQQENPELRVMELRPGATATYFAGATPGAEGKEGHLQVESVAEAVRLAITLPATVRLEELVIRSTSQKPDY